MNKKEVIYDLQNFETEELEYLLDSYTLDQIQTMIQQHAFDYDHMRRIRSYLKQRVITEGEK